MQSVIPSLGELAKDGESGQRKITQYTRYLTVGLALLNALVTCSCLRAMVYLLHLWRACLRHLKTSW